MNQHRRSAGRRRLALTTVLVVPFGALLLAPHALADAGLETNCSVTDVAALDAQGEVTLRSDNVAAVEVHISGRATVEVAGTTASLLQEIGVALDDVAVTVDDQVNGIAATAAPVTGPLPVELPDLLDAALCGDGGGTPQPPATPAPDGGGGGDEDATPEVPVPGLPETTGLDESPQAPSVPSAPALPDLQSAPVTPTAPDAPASPETAAVPDTPAVPADLCDVIGSAPVDALGCDGEDPPAAGEDGQGTVEADAGGSADGTIRTVAGTGVLGALALAVRAALRL